MTCSGTWSWPGVDPQVVVGLLVDRHGFPLEIGCFEGSKAEKHTILPVIRQFQARHGIEAIVVVADAGMLSAANLDDLDEAGLGFIVGSRVTKAPVDLESHFRWHGDAFTGGQVIDALTPKTGKNKENDPALRAEPAWDRKGHPKSWRAVWAFSAKRFARDNRTLTAQENRARDVISGAKAARRGHQQAFHWHFARVRYATVRQHTPQASTAAPVAGNR